MRKWKNAFLGLSLFITFASTSVDACTGLTITANDGSAVFGRTIEWGSFDLNHKLRIVPRRHKERSETPSGKNGKQWEGKYGYVGIDTKVGDSLLDGLNEEGLHVGAFYHLGHAEYNDYNPRKNKKTIDSMKVVEYLLANYKSVEEVKEAINNLDVVGVYNEDLGHEAPLHYIITEESGKSIVIEYTNKEAVVYDNPLGVITNSPNFDWHMTNLRNYLGLSSVNRSAITLDGVDITPTGSGSGMLGLPGDFTPASRFVRAVVFSQSARETVNGEDALDETFRILDNFNVPINSAEGVTPASEGDSSLKSATQATSASDVKNRVFYYHTQNDRRIKKIDLKTIDFDKLKYSSRKLDDGVQDMLTLEIN